MNVQELDHLVLNVADIERSLAWYTDLLGLAPERVGDWRAGRAPFPSVRINDHTVIDLMTIARTGHNVDHFCMVVDRPAVDSIATDDRFDVVDGPAERWGARGAGWSVYVNDPDGNTVELRSYALSRRQGEHRLDSMSLPPDSALGSMVRLWRRNNCHRWHSTG